MKKLLIGGLLALTLSSDVLPSQEQNFMLQVGREGQNLFQENGSVSLAATAQDLEAAINGLDFLEASSLVGTLEILLSNKQIEQIRTEYVIKKGWFKNTKEPVANYMVLNGRGSFVRNDDQDIGVVLANLGFNTYSLNIADQKDFLENYLANITYLIEILSEFDDLNIIQKELLSPNFQMRALAAFHHKAKEDLSDLALNAVELPLEKAKQVLSGALDQALEGCQKELHAVNDLIGNTAIKASAAAALSLLALVVYKYEIGN